MFLRRVVIKATAAQSRLVSQLAVPGSKASRPLSYGLQSPIMNVTAARLFSTAPSSSSTSPTPAKKLFKDDFFEMKEVEDMSGYYDRERVVVAEKIPDFHVETKHMAEMPNRKVRVCLGLFTYIAAMLIYIYIVCLQLHQELNFEKQVETKHYSSIHDLQHGAYVNLDAPTIDKYFPDGFAGDMHLEFELTQRTSWMVRPASKFLCRMIDEYDKLDATKAGVERWRPTEVEKVVIFITEILSVDNCLIEIFNNAETHDIRRIHKPGSMARDQE
jgi:hypothetical protein